MSGLIFDPPGLIDQLLATQENAPRLGLSTTIRPGVVAPQAGTISNVTYVQVDGDRNPVGCMSLLGEELQPTQRVMVMFVRPQGAYIVGYVGTKLPTPWRYVGATDEPAFTNSWANYGAGNHRTVRFRKIGDIVYVEGLMAGGVVGTSAFTLPVGYRPPMKLLHSSVAAAGGSSGQGRTDFEEDGEVLPQNTVDTPFNGFWDVNFSFSVTE